MSRSGLRKPRSSRSKELSARARGQDFQEPVGSAEQHPVAGAASRMAQSLGEKRFAYTHRAAKNDIFMALEKEQPEQLSEACLVEANLGRPIETLQGAFFLEASLPQAIGQVHVIATLDFVGQDQFQELRIVEFFLASIGIAVGQGGQDPGEFQALQYRLPFRLDLDLHEGLLS